MSAAGLGWRRLGWVAAALVIAATGAMLAWQHERRQQETRAAATALYALTLPDAGSTPYALAALRGKPAVVNFWASWCLPCVEEMPELSGMAPQLSGNGIQVVGIGVDNERNVKEFAAKTPVTYPLLVAGAAGIELARRFGDDVGGLPFTVVLDAEGRVVARILGRFDRAKLERAARRAAGLPG